MGPPCYQLFEKADLRVQVDFSNFNSINTVLLLCPLLLRIDERVCIVR